MAKRLRANDFKKLTLGQRVTWFPEPTKYEPFPTVYVCQITALGNNRAIAEEINPKGERPIRAWIDEDTIDQFLLEVV